MSEYLFRKEIAPGIVVHSVAKGERMLLCMVTLKKGSVLPEHSHPHEQASFVQKGHVRFVVEGVPHDCPAGKGLIFAPGTIHGGEVLEDSVISDVFSPVRKDYL